MGEPVERLLAAIRRLSPAERREFLFRLEEEEWYRSLVQAMLQEWDNPQDDAYNRL